MIRRYPRQYGFTMIEVLVALIILAVGLLGVAGVQTLAMKSSTNSHIRSQVNLLTVSMVERIRANALGALNSSYDNISVKGTDPGCGGGCSASQLAQQDVFQWFSELQANVPGFTGASIDYGNGMAEVTINWTERDLSNDAVAQTYQLDARVLQ